MLPVSVSAPVYDMFYATATLGGIAHTSLRDHCRGHVSGELGIAIGCK